MERRQPHPTAAAFFKALDDKKQKSSSQSELIRKRSQSLGWRSRFSQAEHYPVSMSNNDTRFDFTVTQMQRGEIEQTYGTGATVWPASMVLLKYIEMHPELVKDKSVIDLGAGTGVTSIAASFMGAKSVVCTDGTDMVVGLAKTNVATAPSAVAKNVHVERYWWGDQQYNKNFDVVLVSDCVLPKLYPISPLVQALDDTMGNDSVAIFSYEHRHFPQYHPKQKFTELAEAKGLQVFTVPLDQMHPVYSLEDIEIWLVYRRQCDSLTS